MDFKLKKKVWLRDEGFCQNCGKKLFVDSSQKIFEEIKGLKEIPIYKWAKECWRCGKETPIVSYVFTIGFSFNLGDIERLDRVLMEKYSFVKQVFSKTRGCEVIANTCVHCGSLQGNFFIVEDLIDMGVGPNGEDMEKLIDIVLSDNLTPEDLGFEGVELDPFRNRTSDGHIHHKDGNAENNNLSNLILLCADCHMKV